MSAVDLRAGSVADLATVDAIMRAAFDPRYGEAWTQSQCLGILTLPGVWLTLASQDGSPAGFALSRSVLDDGELLLLATHPDHRGQGIGGTLLRATIGQARVRGAERIHLEMRANNPATRLYLREGFAKVGVRRGYYRGNDGATFDAHTLSRAID